MTTRCTRTDPHDCMLGRHLSPPPPLREVAVARPGPLLALDPGTSRSGLGEARMHHRTLALALALVTALIGTAALPAPCRR